MEKTDLTVISTGIKRSLLDNFEGYYVVEKNFTYEDLVFRKKVVFYNILDNFNYKDILSLYKFLRNKGVMFINITNNIELVLYTKYLAIFDKDSFIKDGSVEDLLKNEKDFLRLGFNIPFIVSLSHLMKCYGLLNKDVYTIDEMRVKLWR